MRYSFYAAITVLHSWTDEETGEKYRLVRDKAFDTKKDALAWLQNTKRPSKITAGENNVIVYSRGKWPEDERELMRSIIYKVNPRGKKTKKNSPGIL